MAAATAKASPAQLRKMRSVECSFCQAGKQQPCVVVQRNGVITRRPMINVHPARSALYEFLFF